MYLFDLLFPSGPTKEICLYSAPVWTILLPVTICVTVVSVLLVSGWSVHVVGILKRMTSFRCFRNNKDHFPSNNNGFHSYNNVNYHDNNEQFTEFAQRKQDFPIITQLLLFVIILLGFVMFAVLILFGNLYSETSVILRSQLAICLTSLFQVITFYYGRDSISTARALSVTSGDVIML